jgi:hypothetical protein
VPGGGSPMQMEGISGANVLPAAAPGVPLARTRVGYDPYRRAAVRALLADGVTSPASDHRSVTCSVSLAVQHDMCRVVCR